MLTSDKKLRACKDLKKLPLYEIEWRDSRTSGGWSTLKEYRKKTAVVIKTVGYLTMNTDDDVQVVQSISDIGSISDSMTIPKECVVRTRRLR